MIIFEETEDQDIMYFETEDDFNMVKEIVNSPDIKLKANGQGIDSRLSYVISHFNSFEYTHPHNGELCQRRFGDVYRPMYHLIKEFIDGTVSILVKL